VTIVFWLSVALVAYTYVGYPLILWVFTRAARRALPRAEMLSSVSIVIAARNEADKIRQKIANTLDLDYPPRLREVIVASDASDDGTDDIVREYSSRGVSLVRASHRGGKEYVQALAILVAKGDILVFTDVATNLEPVALRRLVRHFSDPTIGAVSTEDCLVDADGNPTGEGLYVRYEMWVRRLESRFYSLVGLSGSCFGIRRDLCRTWPSTLASDFLAALHAARRNYRAVAEPSARARFVAVASPHAEARRKVRTFLRGITVLVANRDLLNPIKHGRFAFQFASHKLLRFLAPFLLLIALITSAVLRSDTPFNILFQAQLAVYLLGGAGALVPRLQRAPFVRVASYFSMVQGTMLIAWGKYLLGRQQVVWEPSKRHGFTPAARPSNTRKSSAR